VLVELGDGLFFDPLNPSAQIGQFLLDLFALGFELFLFGEALFD